MSGSSVSVNNTPTPIEPNDGATEVVTTMKNSRHKGRKHCITTGSRQSLVGQYSQLEVESSRRHVGKLVSTIVRKCLRKTLHKPVNHTGVSQLVQSLLFPFVARVSLKPTAKWFTEKEMTKLESSVCHMIVVIDKYCDEWNFEQDFIKYFIDAALYKVSGDCLNMGPIRDERIVDKLFVGYLQFILRRMIVRKEIDFVYSLQKGSKKFWPAQSHVKLAAAYVKHAQRFKTDHGRLDPSSYTKIVQVSHEVFKNIIKNKLNTDYTKFMPSGSACLEMKYSDGGKLELFEPFSFPTKDEEAKLGKLRALQMKLEAWRHDNHTRSFKFVQDRLGEETLPWIQDMDAIGIFEPGKIRMITKLSGFLSSAIQPLQGEMMACWKSRKEGTMLNDCLLEEINRIHELTRGTELSYWCSIDYEAATDLIKKDCTIAALSGIQGTPYYTLAIAMFGIGRVNYPPVFSPATSVEKNGKTVLTPEEKYQDGFSIVGIDGQPMGNDLSFVLLCIANLACYLEAIDEWVSSSLELTKDHRKFLSKIMKKCVKINGDDMIFKSTLEFYHLFNKKCSRYGFKSSVGKQYCSPYFAMMNSQVFQCKPSTKVVPSKFYYDKKPVGYWIYCLDNNMIPNPVPSFGKMVQKGYLNLNIVKGVCLKNQTEATPDQVARAANKMIELCPWTRHCIPEIMDRWSDDWLGKRFHPNWYLPVHLGGIGFNREYRPLTWKVTKAQRFVAACYIYDPTLTLYKRLGLRIPTMKYVKSILKYTMRPTSCATVLNENEQLLQDLACEHGDQWLAKIALAARAKDGNVIQEQDSVFANTFILKLWKDRHTRRLHPCDLSTLDKYHNVITTSSFKVPCPPLIPIRNEFDNKEEIVRNINNQDFLTQERNLVIDVELNKLVYNVNNFVRCEEVPKFLPRSLRSLLDILIIEIGHGDYQYDHNRCFKGDEKRHRAFLASDQMLSPLTFFNSFVQPITWMYPGYYAFKREVFLNFDRYFLMLGPRSYLNKSFTTMVVGDKKVTDYFPLFN